MTRSALVGGFPVWGAGDPSFQIKQEFLDFGVLWSFESWLHPGSVAVDASEAVEAIAGSKN